MTGKVKPLRSRTMTLDQLQLETLDLIRKVRFQLQRQGYEEGMSDEEFMEQIVEPLEHKIYADRHILRMNRKAEQKAKGAT